MDFLMLAFVAVVAVATTAWRAIWGSSLEDSRIEEISSGVSYPVEKIWVDHEMIYPAMVYPEWWGKRFHPPYNEGAQVGLHVAGGHGALLLQTTWGELPEWLQDGLAQSYPLGSFGVGQQPAVVGKAILTGLLGSGIAVLDYPIPLLSGDRVPFDWVVESWQDPYDGGIDQTPHGLVVVTDEGYTKEKVEVKVAADGTITLEQFFLLLEVMGRLDDWDEEERVVEIVEVPLPPDLELEYTEQGQKLRVEKEKLAKKEEERRETMERVKNARPPETHEHRMARLAWEKAGRPRRKEPVHNHDGYKWGIPEE